MNDITDTRTGGYYIVCLHTGQKYVGSAGDKRYGFKKRCRDHRKRLDERKHNKWFQAAWDKYGPDAFKFSIKFRGTPEKALAWEQSHEQEYRQDRDKFLNGTVPGFGPSPEDRIAVCSENGKIGGKIGGKKAIKKTLEFNAANNHAGSRKGGKISGKKAIKKTLEFNAANNQAGPRKGGEKAINNLHASNAANNHAGSRKGGKAARDKGTGIFAEGMQSKGAKIGADTRWAAHFAPINRWEDDGGACGR